MRAQNSDAPEYLRAEVYPGPDDLIGWTLRKAPTTEFVTGLNKGHIETFCRSDGTVSKTVREYGGWLKRFRASPMHVATGTISISKSEPKSRCGVLVDVSGHQMEADDVRRFAYVSMAARQFRREIISCLIRCLSMPPTRRRPALS